jgi:polysaccharide pyruvyl transferase WcaK-like protein
LILVPLRRGLPLAFASDTERDEADALDYSCQTLYTKWMDLRETATSPQESVSTVSLKLPRRVAIYGNFGTTNFGNDCTLQAILHNLKRFCPEAEVTCICTGPEAVARTHQIEAIPVVEVFVQSWTPQGSVAKRLRQLFVGIPSEPYRWIKSFFKLAGIELFIIPGTGMLNDVNGVRGWGQYNLLKWTAIARLRGCKVLFVSVGAGPIYTGLGRLITKSALSLADYRSYRDISSKECLEVIGFRTREDRVEPDLAFSLPEAVIPRHTPGNRRPVVGLGLMAYAGRYSHSKPTDEIYFAYLAALVNLAQWLLARGYDVRLLIGDGVDRDAIQEFKRLLRKSLPTGEEERIIDEPVGSVDDLLVQIASTDMVVATRFHNVLLAMLCNKPVIAISFHHKCDSLMRAAGLSEYCLDINGLQPHTLIAEFSELERHADSLRTSIPLKTDEFRTRLEEQYRHIFSRVERNSEGV